MSVSSRGRVSPKFRVNSHHPSSMAENNQRWQETAREHPPIHCIHPWVMQGCFGTVRGALGSILLPPKVSDPTILILNVAQGIKKKRPKNPGPLPRQKFYAPYWVRLGYFARKASVFSMPFSIAGGRAMMIGVSAYVVGVGYYELWPCAAVRQFVLMMMEGDRTENSYPSHCPFDVIKKATFLKC